MVTDGINCHGIDLIVQHQEEGEEDTAQSIDEISLLAIWPGTIIVSNQFKACRSISSHGSMWRQSYEIEVK